MIGQKKIDEFAFVLLGAIIFISIMAVYWYPKAEVISSVKPNKITIHSLPGETIESSFNLTAQGTMNLEAGGQIASWIDFTDDTVYASGKEQIVTFEVNVPSDTALGTYTGYIEVKGNETSKQIPVEIIVENKTMYKERRISISDFSINYEGSTNALHREENVEIYAGLIRHTEKTFIITLTDEQISSISKCVLKMIIDKKKGKGPLIVLLNGKKVYEATPTIGEFDIQLNMSDIGKTNVFTIETKGGLFSSTEYHLYSIELDPYYKTMEKTINITLTDDEIRNFDRIIFSSLLRTTYPVPELVMRLNNQIVYMGYPPLTFLNVSFCKDLVGNKLILNRDNELTIYLETKGRIDFSNVILTVRTRKH